MLRQDDPSDTQNRPVDCCQLMKKVEAWSACFASHSLDGAQVADDCLEPHTKVGYFVHSVLLAGAVQGTGCASCKRKGPPGPAV